MQKTESPVLLAVILCVITAATSLLLAFSNDITKDMISENLQKEQQLALKTVLEADSYTELEFNEISTVKAVYEAKSGDDIKGYCINITPSGYGGEIDMMVGITPDCTVTGIKVISMSETAGLGSKILNSDFTDQFKDKKAGKDNPLNLIKSGIANENEVVAITGATVSSTAVKNGVNDACNAVSMLKEAENE